MYHFLEYLHYPTFHWLQLLSLTTNNMSNKRLTHKSKNDWKMIVLWNLKNAFFLGGGCSNKITMKQYLIHLMTLRYEVRMLYLTLLWTEGGQTFMLWSLQYWSEGSQILVQFIFYIVAIYTPVQTSCPTTTAGLLE